MNTKANILLAEDDDNLGMLLNTYLKAKGFTVTLARDGKDALAKYKNDKYDFLILDVMMPEMDGFTLAKEIRETDKKIPILFLTAKAMKEDKLQGFEIGADDYLTKPFQMEELVARIGAILNRSGVSSAENNEIFTIGNLTFEPEKRILHLPQEDRKLTTKESSLLESWIVKQHCV
jgi:two-component system, OmpR family, response regulator